MSPIELVFSIIRFLGEFPELECTAFPVRQTNPDVQHVPSLQTAILLRTDRTDKTFAHIKTIVEKACPRMAS
jgi:hypothetical protein